ncbi:protein Bouncer-like [Dunckerocampus dactyliophorus]|uniref:protein Bouncer-like n=1 Tax=Dunckerocampus dactyliophorus TaxID=161453 RepID=UPI002404B89C|nr:protein Bouncer-like [Dunckerocampus dactyliophorus]
MVQLVSLLLFLLLLPAVIPLFCYTCVFPATAPLECIRFPVQCPEGQVCLSSRAVGQKGDFRVMMYERSCIQPSLCSVSSEKPIMGLNFTFTNDCCDKHLCNAAATPAAPYWLATLLTPLVSYALKWHTHL